MTEFMIYEYGNKAKHTPGPWYAKGYAGKHDYGIISETDGRDIALVRDYDEANAKLIAAAPELLDALKQAELVIRHAVQESTGRVKREFVGGWLYHAKQIADVIRKATT